MLKIYTTIISNEAVDEDGVMTIVVCQGLQEADRMEMFGSGDRECQYVPYGLMETGVGAAPEADRLVLVLEVILNMTHLMVDGEQLVHGHRGALLNPAENKQASSFETQSHYQFNCLYPPVLFVMKSCNPNPGMEWYSLSAHDDALIFRMFRLPFIVQYRSAKIYNFSKTRE